MIHIVCMYLGIGLRGDLAKVSRDYARKVLLLARLVEYASPENIKKYEQIRKVYNKVNMFR